MPKLRPKAHISLKIPAKMLDEIDAQADYEGRGRSNWIRKTIQKELMFVKATIKRTGKHPRQLEMEF